MLRQSWRLATLALAVFALAACQITITPIPFDPVVVGIIVAQDEGRTPRRTDVTIRSGETLIYEVHLPTARDLLYGDSDGNGLRLRWLSRSGETLAVSENPRWFVGSTAGLSASDVEELLLARDEIGSSIAIDLQCFGPCAAIDPGNAPYYLEVRNQSPSTQVFDLYVYTLDANDQYDRRGLSNDTFDSATPFGASSIASGAIELVGDHDWFWYTGTDVRDLRFSVFDEAVGLVLEFADGFTVEGTTAGLTTIVRPNERFRVYSPIRRAGPYGTSGYTIFLP